MSPPNFPFSLRRAAAWLAPLSLACAASANASADPWVSDAIGDFAPTYVGVQIDQVDIRDAAAVYLGGAFNVVSTHSFANPGETPDGITPLYVWGVDRGAGQARLTSGTPSIGQGVTFDALIVLSGNSDQGFSGSVTTFGPGGALTSSIGVDPYGIGDLIGAFVDEDLLPSTGFAFADYRFNLWTRDGAGNAHIADFAVDGGMFRAENLAPVPEPTTWALLIAGFGLAGATLRRRRAGLAPA